MWTIRNRKGDYFPYKVYFDTTFVISTQTYLGARLAVWRRRNWKYWDDTDFVVWSSK